MADGAATEDEDAEFALGVLGGYARTLLELMEERGVRFVVSAVSSDPHWMRMEADVVLRYLQSPERTLAECLGVTVETYRAYRKWRERPLALEDEDEYGHRTPYRGCVVDGCANRTAVFDCPPGRFEPGRTDHCPGHGGLPYRQYRIKFE